MPKRKDRNKSRNSKKPEISKEDDFDLLVSPTRPSSSKAAVLASMVAILAVATGWWIQRDQLVGFVVALPLTSLSSSSSKSNESWKENEAQVEVFSKGELTDEQLRKLAKFWSQNKVQDISEEAKEEVVEEPIVEEVVIEEPVVEEVVEDSIEDVVEEVQDNTVYTLVSVAPYHDYTKEGKDQKEDMVKYMHFDDGYTTCINVDDLRKDPSVAAALELKHSKFMMLQRMANQPERWTVNIPECTEPSVVDQALFQNLLPTCRLLTLTQEEFDGKALQVIKDALIDESHILTITEKLNNAAEFRALACLARLIDEFLRIIPDQIPRAAMESLKQSWALIAKEAYHAASYEPLPPLPSGWRELRNDKSSGHAYYVEEATGHTTWIRPLPDGSAKRQLSAKSVDPLQKRASLIARNSPCKSEMSDWLLGKK